MSRIQPTALLQTIGNHTPNLIYVKDLQGRFLLVNDRFCEALGLSRKEVVGRTPHELFAAPIAESHLANDRQVAASGKTMTFPEFAELPDGRHEYVSTKFPVTDRTGRLAAVGGVSVDITAQKKVEASLRESEEKFRLAFQANPLAINLNGLADGKYLDINEGFTRLMGYSREEVLGKTSVELGIWAEAADRERLVGELSSTGRVEDLRARFRRKNGEIGIGLMSARVLSIAGERVILSLTRDITAEVELEEKYRQAQKMEAVGRLAGGVAHDFNNLLVPLLSYAEMLGQTLAPEDERRYMVEEILHAGRRAANLTRQILAFSRKQVLEVGALDLNRLVGEFQAMIARLLRENIEVRLELAPDLPLVWADRTQLEQVLMNLAVNAGDAMPAGGRLTIQTCAGRDPDDPAAEPGAVLVVSDTGLGMSADTLSHLFEPFFTTKEPGKGTGLGLATVFGIVQQHRGQIRVASTPGQGTSFRIYLPLAGRSEAPAAARPAASGGLEGTETVLVVEDDERVRALVSGVLRGRGYTVQVAEDAAAALRLFAGGGPGPSGRTC